MGAKEDPRDPLGSPKGPPRDPPGTPRGTPRDPEGTPMRLHGASRMSEMKTNSKKMKKNQRAFRHKHIFHFF